MNHKLADDIVTEFLYKTPPPHRTHHDPTFTLSPAIFAFDLSFVIQKYRDRIAEYDKTATEYTVGPGHKLQRDALNDALTDLQAITLDEKQFCPDTAASTFSDAMGDSVYDRFTTVHCDACDAEYNSQSVIKTQWVVDNGDGSGSSGWRLVCPKQHVLYASIVSVTD